MIYLLSKYVAWHWLFCLVFVTLLGLRYSCRHTVNIIHQLAQSNTTLSTNHYPHILLPSPKFRWHYYSYQMCVELCNNSKLCPAVRALGWVQATAAATQWLSDSGGAWHNNPGLSPAYSQFQGCISEPPLWGWTLVIAIHILHWTGWSGLVHLNVKSNEGVVVCEGGWAAGGMES